LVLVSSPAFSLENTSSNLNNHYSSTPLSPENLDDTCLDEYGLRNGYLKKFLIYAPPTVIVSVPVLSYAYFLGMYALLSIAPYELLFIAGYGLWYLAVPAVIGTAITFEVKYSIEYFRNRAMVRVVDAIRSNNIKNKYVKRFVKKFRKKYPKSQLTNNQIINEILNLDKNQSLCNGVLTESTSDKIQKLLAKKKHVLKYLGSL